MASTQLTTECVNHVTGLRCKCPACAKTDSSTPVTPEGRGRVLFEFRLGLLQHRPLRAGGNLLDRVDGQALAGDAVR
jgi:hypothetical protein